MNHAYQARSLADTLKQLIPKQQKPKLMVKIPKHPFDAIMVPIPPDVNPVDGQSHMPIRDISPGYSIDQQPSIPHITSTPSPTTIPFKQSAAPPSTHPRKIPASNRPAPPPPSPPPRTAPSSPQVPPTTYSPHKATPPPCRPPARRTAPSPPTTTNIPPAYRAPPLPPLSPNARRIPPSPPTPSPPIMPPPRRFESASPSTSYLSIMRPPRRAPPPLPDTPSITPPSLTFLNRLSVCIPSDSLDDLRNIDPSSLKKQLNLPFDLPFPHHSQKPVRVMSNQDLYSWNNYTVQECVNPVADISIQVTFPYHPVVIKQPSTSSSISVIIDPQTKQSVCDNNHANMRRNHRRTRSDVEIRSPWSTRITQDVSVLQEPLYVKPTGTDYGNIIQKGKSCINMLDASSIGIEKKQHPPVYDNSTTKTFKV